MGNTAPSRDFIDVRDVASAFDALMAHGKAGQVYNIGSGKDTSIKEVIDKLMQIVGMQVPVESVPDRRWVVDVLRMRAGISRITADVGWRSRVSLYESLETMWGKLGVDS